MNRFQPVTARPSNGGALITRASGDVVGPYNYIVKRDFRRDMDREIRREGHDYFWPNKSLPLGQQPFPNYPNVDEPITLIHLVRRPNGKTAVLAATPTTIFRYFALENGAYMALADDHTPYVSDEEDEPYFDDNPGQWVVIGSGFAGDAQRWEAWNINGYVILNNSVDLPVSYRVEDMAVVPLYELRENGVAAIGTIAEFSSILMGADISQITEDALENLLSPISSGDVQAGQTGSIYSGLATATQDAGSLNVVADSTSFNGGVGFTTDMAGKTLRFSNGFSRSIVVVVDATHATLAGPAPADDNLELPFYIVSDGSPDFMVTADGDIFTPTMVGENIIWPGKASKKIVAVIDAQHVRVDSDISVPAGTFVVTNPSAYARFTDSSKIDRIQYRVIWSAPNQPRNFAGVSFGSTTAKSNVLTLKYPVKSLQAGRQIFVLGAGVLGGNLAATVVFASNDLSVILDVSASTTMVDTEIQAIDAAGSIVGFYDVEDDSSAILRLLDLRGTLVVYKDTGIFLGQYTTNVVNPFQFSRIYTGSKSLFYRYTLIDLSGLYHIYAGKNAFYRFDLTTQVPIEFEPAELIADLFFGHAKLENTNLIFAADNAVTKEIFFCFPSASQDKALCYDYKTKPGTFSTTSAEFTAAATIKKPVAGISVGPIEEWFCMGTKDGTLLRYGKSNLAPADSGDITAIQTADTITASAPIFTVEHIGQSLLFASGRLTNIVALISNTQVTVGDVAESTEPESFLLLSECYHRLGAPYVSVLQGGLISFGDDFNEKDMTEYVLYLAQQSLNGPILFELFATRNAAEKVKRLGTLTLAVPKSYNSIPLFFRSNYFQDRLTVDGINNPCQIEARTFNVTAIDSRSTVRRQP